MVWRGLWRRLVRLAVAAALTVCSTATCALRSAKPAGRSRRCNSARVAAPSLASACTAAISACSAFTAVWSPATAAARSSASSSGSAAPPRWWSDPPADHRFPWMRPNSRPMMSQRTSTCWNSSRSETSRNWAVVAAGRGAAGEGAHAARPTAAGGQEQQRSGRTVATGTPPMHHARRGDGPGR